MLGHLGQWNEFRQRLALHFRLRCSHEIEFNENAFLRPQLPIAAVRNDRVGALHIRFVLHRRYH